MCQFLSIAIIRTINITKLGKVGAITFFDEALTWVGEKSVAEHSRITDLKNEQLLQLFIKAKLCQLINFAFDKG